MPPLDTRTLMVVALLTAGIIGVVLLLTWWINRSMKALGYWSTAYFFYTAGIAELAFRSSMTVQAWNMAGVVLLGMGHLCVLFGTRSLAGKSIPWATGAAMLSGLIAAWMYFRFVDSSFAMRYAGYSAFVALAAGLSSLELFRVRRETLVSSITVLGVVYAIIAFANIVRAVLSAAGQISDSILDSGVMQTQQFLQANALLVTAGICMVVVSTERLQSELRRSAIYDRLTGVFNRGAFVDLAEREVARWRRSGTRFSVLLMDLDHFKRINDQFGHPAGDAVLVAFTRLCGEGLRDGDLLGRYGGEEFCALLPGSDLAQAAAVAERLRRNASTMTVDWDGIPLSVTVSIGVAELGSSVPDFDRLIAQADAALYEAKDAGRDRVVTARPPQQAQAVPGLAHSA